MVNWSRPLESTTSSFVRVEEARHIVVMSTRVGRIIDRCLAMRRVIRVALRRASDDMVRRSDFVNDE